MAVLLDTNAIVAISNRNDAHYKDIHGALSTAHESFIVPLPVLGEVDYLVTKRAGARSALRVLHSLLQGDIVIDHLAHEDLVRAAEVMDTYLDADIGFVDSIIVSVAERLSITRILTLDRRHFSLIRPRHCAAFELLP